MHVALTQVSFPRSIVPFRFFPLGFVCQNVIFTHRTNLLPDFVASCPFLKAECQVQVFTLGPDDEGLLLLLVRGVGLDFRLEEEGTWNKKAGSILTAPPPHKPCHSEMRIILALSLFFSHRPTLL